MSDGHQQARGDQARRYRSFEEFSGHFYGPKNPEPSASDPDASFGIKLSRELVRERSKPFDPKSDHGEPSQ